jgi:selenium metabolism protein YedF
MANESSPLDCRGLACPEPVLRTKMALDALGGEGILSVLVDNEASRDNVRRFAESQGATVSISPAAGGWQVAIAKGYACEAPAPAPAASAVGKAAFLVTTDHIGPEPELGKILMRAFLGTLGKVESRPEKLMLLNRGVFLATEGSEVLDVLRELEAAGVQVMSCGTCLEFFDRKESLRVGRISNMYETLEILTGPRKVVTIS